MKDYEYQSKIEEFQRLRLEEQRKRYDEYFSIHPEELRNTEIIGITDIDDSNRIIFCEEDDIKYLIHNEDDSFYYIQSSQNGSDLMNEVFNTKEYEVLDDNLIVKKGDKALSENHDIKNYHSNSNNNFSFNKSIMAVRKEILVDPEKIEEKAKEDLAQKHKLPKDTFSREVVITGIEEDKDNKATLTMKDENTNRKQYLYTDFNDEFREEVKEGLSFKDSLKFMFEEVKNASAQMTMGFLEFYGARFDEESIEYDTRAMIENGEYKISQFNQDGSKVDLKNNLNQKDIDKELDSILQQRTTEEQLKRSNDLSQELEIKNNKDGVE